jgi:3-keto-5-aminohexanoate cleavage enzyme
MKKRVLIANRGEIAVRLIKACKALDIETVLAVSEADRDSTGAKVFHHGQLWLVNNLIEKGLVKPPYCIQFCMGASSGAYPTPKYLLHMLETAPMPSVFHVLGVGHYQTAMITIGILLGIHVRTGMEDNVLYKTRELCKSNAQLVERVVRIAQELEREIATPKQARQMLGLSDKPTKY